MRLFITFLSLILSLSCLAKQVQLLDMRVFKPTAQKMRLVFELDAIPVTHNIFTLKIPHRLVIDLKNTKLLRKLQLPYNETLVKKIRSAPRHQKDLRVVLDLKTPVRTKSFLLKPDETNGHRLVIEINTLNLNSKAKKSRSLEIATFQTSRVPISLMKSSPTPRSKRDIVIAIDAGHGGIDSGASGLGGTLEKDVVLAIAKELAALVAKTPGMRGVLIRNGDYFIKLRKRIQLARQYQADLFISIHADAYPDDIKVQGSSVYILSHHGASSEMARWLAEKENAADLISGIRLNDKDKLLAQVLLDLSMLSTLEASAYVGQSVLKRLQSVSKVHASQLQRANFMVLSSPDIPSILIETGFISNPREEQKLSDINYRRQLAQAIYEGIREYIANYVLSDTLLVRR
ncbi:MAG: N-acetylmuramoyl-L-alanine amidase [Gammaproteobacteria bacterium]|nr:MAG: N-acetylmuramoyl-L-alanine amidase [Gammaproteobacteria bacterium]RKZ42914.1 MAG: N-acetylmuramoyl-L-alanine amidase [Gammaproteobacteria bacterium]RKZ76613.1 MAG: N-acetylmuramoyl-L-alanine amidase [Gammaproteobacteria bacterium]